jgi:uncharacterized Fe-S cluster-containing radical SAM superfamily protein
LSGGEPTLGWSHLTRLLELMDRDRDLTFILETNGIILGYDRNKACELSEFKNLHVRLSIKACSAELFTKLTLAKPEAFEYQIKAAKNLADCNVDFHIAIFASFGDDRCWANLIEKLASDVGSDILGKIEVEYLILYPNVKRRLKLLERMGIKPRVVYSP